MKEYYHNLITEKSFKVLQDIKREYNFVLIGGWAVFLYTKALKSKDIDIIIDYNELGKLKKRFDVFKNDRLKKYEVKINEIDIDIYLPHFSKIGIPVEEIEKHTHSIEGFRVPLAEILLILKIYVFQQRRGSLKGKKDLIDVFSLLSKEVINWQKYRELIKRYKFQELNEKLKELVSSQSPIPELDLLNHKIAKLKKETSKQLKTCPAFGGIPPFGGDNL